MSRVSVWHNSVHGSHPGAGPYALVIFDDVTDIDLRNNIIHGTLDYAGGANDARCVMNQGASSFSVRDFNLYHQDDPAQPFTGSEYGVGGWDTFISEWNSAPDLGAVEVGAALPTLSVGDASAVEGAGGTRTLTFTVTLSDTSDQPPAGEGSAGDTTPPTEAPSTP
jgi:hypothetical protein